MIFMMAGKVKDKSMSMVVGEHNLPPTGKLVLVMCWHANHIGYRDQNGRWRHATHHQELPHVLGWCALSAKGW